MRETVKNDGRTTQRELKEKKSSDQIKRKRMSFLVISYVISRLIEFVSGVDIYEAEGGGKVKHMPCQELFPKVTCDAKGREMQQHTKALICVSMKSLLVSLNSQADAVVQES